MSDNELGNSWKELRLYAVVSPMPWKPLAIILAVLLLAALVVIALIGFELTDFSFSLF
jgi:hypothetical protein